MCGRRVELNMGAAYAVLASLSLCQPCVWRNRVGCVGCMQGEEEDPPSVPVRLKFFPGGKGD